MSASPLVTLLHKRRRRSKSVFYTLYQAPWPISETTLKDAMLMLIEEQNKKGGVLGKELEPVVVDPASN